MGVNAVIPAAVTSTLSHSRSQSQSNAGSSARYDPRYQAQAQSYAQALKHGDDGNTDVKGNGNGTGPGRFKGRGVTIEDLRSASYGSTDMSDPSSSSTSLARDAEDEIEDYGVTTSQGIYPSSSKIGAGAGAGGSGRVLLPSGQIVLDGARGSEWDQRSEDDEDDDDEFGLEPEIPVTWRYMSRLYLLVPIITLVWLALLIMLVTYAWPPTRKEREAGQQYPHPFLWKPFIIGVFASCTVQTIRVPVWVVVSWARFSQGITTFWSTSIHAIIHESLRMSTLPLIIPSPTSGFHSSYYLGLGWGVAEVTWGIVQGWEQLELYKEVMRLSPTSTSFRQRGVRLPTDDDDLEAQTPTTVTIVNTRTGNGNAIKTDPKLSSVTERSDEDDEVLEEEDEDEDEDEEGIEEREEQERIEEEDELERKVEILERMRARRDLEEVLGIPFPNIPFPLHLLWRLDTLLLNLGLTLLLSAFYFNSSPIYRHSSIDTAASDTLLVHGKRGNGIVVPDTEPSKWLWLAWVLVALVHVLVSLVWKVVGRVGVGAVTWGGLIVALGSVFAGLGCWGGLV
ncbi:hypothetical protein I316_00339 [Kwoniella heveanensis BCC8398]|uniref:Uncharacterized protein n=1 Tax=Kwoniella heveanensis BCC8398 TaxID=1296120 RepID=A0A1B9H4B9_9TREE|nr:hypothetical protein I316_00339 [Kwoniella heveanensis BCC8398]